MREHIGCCEWEHSIWGLRENHTWGLRSLSFTFHSSTNSIKTFSLDPHPFLRYEIIITSGERLETSVFFNKLKTTKNESVFSRTIFSTHSDGNHNASQLSQKWICSLFSVKKKEMKMWSITLPNCVPKDDVDEINNLNCLKCQ